MTVQELSQLISSYTVSTTIFPIEKQLFYSENGRKTYNATIKNKVNVKGFGIYIWVNSATGEVVYIGMAGKVKTDGSICDHSLSQRLKASRERCKETNKYIQTNDYLKNFMAAKNIDILDFYIFYTKTGEPPSYVEAVLLYNYFKRNNKLPVLNNAF